MGFVELAVFALVCLFGVMFLMCVVLGGGFGFFEVFGLGFVGGFCWGYVGCDVYSCLGGGCDSL